MIPLPPVSKSIWTCCMEALCEYCRIVWDIFPKQKFLRFVVSDVSSRTLNTWSSKEQSNGFVSAMYLFQFVTVCLQLSRFFYFNHALTIGLRLICHFAWNFIFIFLHYLSNHRSVTCYASFALHLNKYLSICCLHQWCLGIQSNISTIFSTALREKQWNQLVNIHNRKPVSISWQHGGGVTWSSELMTPMLYYGILLYSAIT